MKTVWCSYTYELDGKIKFGNCDFKIYDCNIGSQEDVEWLQGKLAKQECLDELVILYWKYV